DATLLPELLPDGTIAVIDDLAEISEQGRSYLDRVADARGLQSVATVLKRVGASSRCRRSPKALPKPWGSSPSSPPAVAPWS
ncbi:MAG: hypothetical protein ACYTGC_20320, partial [Planctomycetota bacterium]